MVENERKIEKIIVGLGNPGEEYTGSRHNLGWLALDVFIRENGIKKKFDGDKRSRIQEVEIDGTRVLLVKPTTYMNLSGTAVLPLLKKHELELNDLLVVHDDMDLLPGRAKIRVGGGGGGHKGILSLMEHCGEDFARLKIGIGRPEDFTDDDEDVDWVLGKLEGDELEIITAVMPVVASAMKIWLEQGSERAMNSFNTAMREIFSAVEEQELKETGREGSDG